MIMLNTQFVEHGDKALIEAFVGADALRERHVDDFIVTIAHHDITLTLKKCPYSADTSAAGQDAVAG
jgi:hypothetical protein